MRILPLIFVVALVPHSLPSRLILRDAEAVSVAQASNAAIEQARKGWQETSSEWLRASRREDLEDDWLGFQKLHGQPIRKDFYFFAVSYIGTRISDDGSRLLTQTLMDADRPSGIVAISTASAHTYLLAGFPRDSHFDDLLNDSQVSVNGQSLAYLFADLYVRLTTPESRGISQVHDLLSLKQLAEDKFAEHYKDEKKAEDSFERWWPTFRKEHTNFVWNPPVVQNANGFEVQFYTLSAIDRKDEARGPAFMRISLDIWPDGHVAKPVIQPVGTR